MGPWSGGKAVDPGCQENWSVGPGSATGVALGSSNLWAFIVTYENGGLSVVHVVLFRPFQLLYSVFVVVVVCHVKVPGLGE